MTVFRNLSIGHKLTAFALATACLVLLLAASVFVVIDIVMYRQSMVQEMRTISKIVANNSRAALVFGNAFELAEKKVVVAVVGCARTRITRRKDSRPAIERIHTDSRVVGDGWQTRRRHCMPRLDQGVFDKGSTGLVGIGDAEF